LVQLLKLMTSGVSHPQVGLFIATAAGVPGCCAQQQAVFE
jgi:hypothetical protein